MLSLRHILLPTDFSRRSVVAARHAAPLAKHFHSKITLLHVAQVVRLSPGDVRVNRIVVEETLAEHQKQVRAQLHSFLAEELAEFEVNRVLAEGDPAGKIVEYAHSENVDLIMMPTRQCARSSAPSILPPTFRSTCGGRAGLQKNLMPNW